MKYFQHIKNRYQNAKLQTRLFISALLPLLMIALLLTSYTIYIQQKQARSHLNTTASTTINYLASASQFALYSGNINELEVIASALLNHEEIIGILFISSGQHALYKAGDISLPKKWRDSLPATSSNTFEKQQTHIKQVVSELTDVDDQLLNSDEELLSDKSTLPLGWVAISISEKSLYSSLQKTLATSAMLAGAGIALSALLSILISRSILNPIGNLIQTVKQIDQGKQEARATVKGTTETKTLARVVNQLAASSQESTNNLQQAVENATANLRNAIADTERRNTLLEQTRQDLSNALSTKKEFVARMSHELRTPLTSVIGYTKLLSIDPKDDEQQRFKHHALHASQVLLERIDDILCFEKIESGNLELNIIPFGLRRCLQDLVNMHNQEAADKELEIVLSISPEIPDSLLGDASRIKQIYNNLIANSIKFTRKGSVTILTELLNKSSTTVTLAITVSDTGIGIEPKNIDKLFTPFMQADNTISRHYGGTGLGLIISKQLLSSMNGNIEIVSKPGDGTQAITEITLGVTNKKVQKIETTSLKPDAGITVLLFDENSTSQKAIDNTLAWAGISTINATSKTQLENLVNNNTSITHILLGANHHSINDIALCLSALRKQTNIPFIVASTHLFANEAIESETWSQLQPLHYVNKPISDDILLRAIGLHLPQNNEATAIDELPSNALQGVSICLIEDNQFNRELIEDTLSKHQADVTSFSSAIDAIPFTETQPPKIIITDLHMPEMTGIELTHYIRNSKIGHDVIIIVLTADLSGKHDILFAGANAILHKPIDEKQLLNTLLSALGLDDRVPNQSSILPNTPEALKRWISELQRLSDIIASNKTNIFSQDQASLNTDIKQALHDLIGIVSLHENKALNEAAEQLSHAIHHGDEIDIEHTLTHFNQLLRKQRDSLIKS